MKQDIQILLDQVQFLIEAEEFDQLQTLLLEQRTADTAEVVESLSREYKGVVIDLMPPVMAAEVLEKVDEATRSHLFDILEDNVLHGLISEMDAEDAADILAELPEDESHEILQNLEPEDVAQIRNLMKYSEDSAGGIMDPTIVVVPEQATVNQAILDIQSRESDEDFFSIYVVNARGQFVGDIRIRKLLSCGGWTKISELVEKDTIWVNVHADQEEVRNIFSKHDLIVVPVLDDKMRVVGRITADRIIEVAEDEAAEDIYTMAGTDADELEDASVVRAARIRMTWLLPCLAGTAITACMMFLFKGLYSNNIGVPGGFFGVVVAFVPMIAAISGNAGLQTSAIVVTGLATGHLAAGRLSKVFMREVRIAFIVAICCGIVGGIICSVLPHVINFDNGAEHVDLTSQLLTKLVTAFCVAMFSSIMVATTLGLFLPFLFRRVGIDPAISSGPLVTTANDSISVTIYLSIALALIQI